MAYFINNLMALNVLYANFDHESINYPGISIFSLKGKKKKKRKAKTSSTGTLRELV